MFRIAALSLVLTLLLACKRGSVDEAKYALAGSEAVLPLKKGLKQALVKGLENGPMEAISACRVQAPELAATLNAGPTKVGRSSLKLRNPENAAKAWMEPLLQAYESDPENREPKVVLIDEHTVGYVEPIYLQPLCVTCHGPALAPDLQAKLKELYPSDEATGYAAGDLRGVFWAELPRE